MKNNCRTHTHLGLKMCQNWLCVELIGVKSFGNSEQKPFGIEYSNNWQWSVDEGRTGSVMSLTSLTYRLALTLESEGMCPRIESEGKTPGQDLVYRRRRRALAFESEGKNCFQKRRQVYKDWWRYRPREYSMNIERLDLVSGPGRPALCTRLQLYA